MRQICRMATTQRANFRARASRTLLAVRRVSLPWLSLVPLFLLGCFLFSGLVERHRHHVHGLIQCGLSRLRQRRGPLRYNVALAVEALHHHV